MDGITIRRLTPELSGDYFDFFENRAFTDGSPYRCYCQVYQLTKEQSDEALAGVEGADIGRVCRKIAEEQIQAGLLRGYLAYDRGVSIGWCNANDKACYPEESCVGTHFHAPAEKREVAVVCFEIAPEYRGRGIATALLQRVLDDAAAEGYRAVEGFPVLRDERYEWDSPGPIRLYEKLGFSKVAERDGLAVMRWECGRPSGA
ncbi:MAG TPA: GNAT family N-acetyltransferase [Firmicutes bacterium]|nr:GNAT family N-acetyltransferase [Bacillota bacterium]